MSNPLRERAPTPEINDGETESDSDMGEDAYDSCASPPYATRDTTPPPRLTGNPAAPAQAAPVPTEKTLGKRPAQVASKPQRVTTEKTLGKRPRRGLSAVPDRTKQLPSLKDFKRGYDSTKVVQNQNGMGRGLVALKKIKEGVCITHYAGVNLKDTSQLPKRKPRYLYQLTDGSFIDAESVVTGPHNSMERGGLLNHACGKSVNCTFIECDIDGRCSVIAVTTRDVEPGEPLFVSYGNKYNFDTCRCPDCRRQ